MSRTLLKESKCIHIMTAFFLIIPLFLIRYGLLAFLDTKALKRAAHFPPMIGAEKTAYWLYQIMTILILVWICFLKIKTGSTLFNIGLIIYLLGILMLILSTIDFAKPSTNGLNQNGLYRFSRNPMYVGYFTYFLGCVLLTQSWMLFIFLLIFQVATHWIILSEERWCVESYGQTYIRYTQKVRRYI